MAKKEKNKVQIRIHPDAVVARGCNTEIAIVKQEPSKRRFAATNLVCIKSLTINSGHNAGVTHQLSEDGKIKFSTVGLTTRALLELHMALGQYLEKIVLEEVINIQNQ